MPVQFRLYIVRHGETEWNRIRRIHGHLDIPINDTGLKQAMLVAEALKDIPFARVLSSNLQRASKTAKCILRYHPDLVLEQDGAMRERYMGELQGEIAPSNKLAPSMETKPNFIARCLALYSRSIVSYLVAAARTGPPATGPCNILAVTHGSWTRVLFSALVANGLVTCREGVEVGPCLNTGVSIIEYSAIPIMEGEVVVGTVVQYSGVQHLSVKGLHSQDMNADELESEESKVVV